MTPHRCKANTQLIINIYTKNVSTHAQSKETKLTLHAQSDHTQYMINNSNYHSAEMDIMQLSDQL